MREVMISQRTLAHSLAYMQWDPTMSLENLKNTSHHIHTVAHKSNAKPIFLALNAYISLITNS